MDFLALPQVAKMIQAGSTRRNFYQIALNKTHIHHFLDVYGVKLGKVKLFPNDFA